MHIENIENKVSPPVAISSHNEEGRKSTGNLTNEQEDYFKTLSYNTTHNELKIIVYSSIFLKKTVSVKKENSSEEMLFLSLVGKNSTFQQRMALDLTDIPKGLSSTA